MSAGRCTPEMAAKIVALLRNDPGTARSTIREDDPFAESPRAERTCPGCDAVFKPAHAARQYCSRACYDGWLARRTAERSKAERARPTRSSKAGPGLGSGYRFAGEPARGVYAQRGLATAATVQEQLEQRFGLRVARGTIYNCWRRDSPPA